MERLKAWLTRVFCKHDRMAVAYLIDQARQPSIIYFSMACHECGRNWHQVEEADSTIHELSNN